MLNKDKKIYLLYNKNINEYIMKKKLIKLTEQDLNNIVKETINEITNSYQKKKLINLIHKRTQILTSKLYHDEAWQGVKQIYNTIQNIVGNEGEVSMWCENGGYWKQLGEFPNYKEYKLQIKLNDNIEINGSVKCHAAGTIEDTFKNYDITINMW
jgi:hypothetical protein